MAGNEKQHFSLKSFNSYLPSTYCVPGAVLGAGGNRGIWLTLLGVPAIGRGGLMFLCDEPDQELQALTPLTS